MKIKIDNLMVEETEETKPCVISLSCAMQEEGGPVQKIRWVCVCVG